MIGQGPDGQYRAASQSDPRRWIYTDGFHLVVDGDRPIEVLHQFATRVGLRPEWFQADQGCYFLTTPLAAERAVASGAALIDMRDTARVRQPHGHPKRPAGMEPRVLGRGAPAFRLARERHGEVMEFIQGPGNRAWQGKGNNNPAQADARGEGGLVRQQRIVRL